MDLKLVAKIRRDVARMGFAWVPNIGRGPPRPQLLELARSFGRLFVPPGRHPLEPILETRPSAHAPVSAPFDRAEAIGWHNDFSTHRSRPRVSLAYIERADPQGPEQGAWRVAPTSQVFGCLRATPEGRAILRFLMLATLPYSFAGESPAYYHAVGRSPICRSRLGLRFYGRAMRNGASLAYGTVPPEVERAIAGIEDAADRVGRVLPATAGALLVTDNWRSLHDRLAQSVDAVRPLRRSLLCFADSGDNVA